MRCTSTRHSAAAALLCLLALVAAAAAARPGASAAASSSAAGLRRLQQGKQQQCFDAFNQYGGTSGISTRVPACSQTNFKLEECCSQTKAALALGPEGCLCDAAVWSEVERQMTSSGVQGLTPDSLRLFTRTCGIPNAGAGTC